MKANPLSLWERAGVRVRGMVGAWWINLQADKKEYES